MIRRIVKDKDGNIIEDVKLDIPKKVVDVKSQSNTKERQDRKAIKKLK